MRFSDHLVRHLKGSIHNSIALPDLCSVLSFVTVQSQVEFVVHNT